MLCTASGIFHFYNLIVALDVSWPFMTQTKSPSSPNLNLSPSRQGPPIFQLSSRNQSMYNSFSSACPEPIWKPEPTETLNSSHGSWFTSFAPQTSRLSSSFHHMSQDQSPGHRMSQSLMSSSFHHMPQEQSPGRVSFGKLTELTPD